MKKIYFVLTHTGTILSKIIKGYTKNEFSHVSIALDEDLNELYSFGRKNPYNALNGGLVHEYIHDGTFKRFKRTKCKIYSLNVSQKEYEAVEKNILDMYQKKDIYKFNIVGLIAVSVNKKISMKNRYYCAEFVKYILKKSNIKNNLPDIVKPEDFRNLEGITEIYTGYLKDYR